MTLSALVIREPWISLILDGQKTWEMRSRPNGLERRIALVRKGTGQVVGVAHLGRSEPPLTRDTYGYYFSKHAIPEDQVDDAVAKGWVHPWTLKDVYPLSRPVPYRHNSGAVTFVTLDPSVTEQIIRQLPDGREPAARPTSLPARLHAEPADAKQPASAPATEPRQRPPAPTGTNPDETPLFVFRPQTAQAYGRPLPEGGFLVLAGSTAMRNGSPNVKRDAAYCEELIRTGVLVPDASPCHYRFSQDHAFPSSSKAAGVIKDGNASGPSSWTDEKTRKKLKHFLDPK